MRRLVLTLLIGLLLLGSSTMAWAIPEPGADFYVNDFVGLFSTDTIDEIMATAPLLAEETGAQIVVVTVSSLEGLTPQEYATTLAEEWQVGDRIRRNGLVILLAPGEGKIWVWAGFGLRDVLNSSRASLYIEEYALEAYERRDYDGGTLQLYRALLSQLRVKYGQEALEGYEPLPQEHNLSLSTGIIIISLVAIMMILGRKRRRHKRSNSSGHSGGRRRGGGGGLRQSKVKNLRDGSSNYRYGGRTGR